MNDFDTVRRQCMQGDFAKEEMAVAALDRIEARVKELERERDAWKVEALHHNDEVTRLRAKL